MPSSENIGANGVKVNGYTNGSNINGFNGHLLNGNSSGHVSSVDSAPEPVAICGFALRLPGGICSADTFWDVLRNGKDMRRPISPSRYNAKGFDDSLGSASAIKTQYGYFLDNDLSHLDTSFFSMSKAELEKVDPQQRQLLEVTRECLENAGEANYRGKPIGCYVGTFGEDWLNMLAKENQNTGGYILSGFGDLMLANRVSYEFDFRGPSVVTKTGCSASLVALHEACNALKNGDCTSAIVAGTSLIMGPTTTAAMTLEGVLSPDGSCKTFDASADGFARGEAIVSIYIKRLTDALRDGDPVRAVLRNTGTNSDGKNQGLMTPNGEAQEALMRKVYHDAGLNPEQTGFVECHGTGTATGDPIEVNAVGSVFQTKGVFIGSVKPNVGHTEGASGITSLIKAILALENQTIPPNIKLVNPNPKILFSENRLKVPLQPVAWPKDKAQRISINSFGIGGTNAHVIVESLHQYQAPSSSMHGTRTQSLASPSLLVFSANTKNSLASLVDNSLQYLKERPDSLKDLAYTLARRREHLPHRAFSIAIGDDVSNVSPFAKCPTLSPRLVMVFTGQGAQWPRMGYELIQGDEKVRKDILAMDETLQSLKYPPDWNIENKLLKSGDDGEVHRAELSQPLCTAIQLAMVNVYRRHGIQPQAVVGHSSGEIAAAYAIGKLTMSEAITIAYYRGYVTKFQQLVGGMAAVGLDAETTSAMLQPGVVIACENSPNSTTISGDLDQLSNVLSDINERHPHILARKLKVNMAYHSPQMVPLSKQYLNLLAEEMGHGSFVRSSDGISFSTVSGSALPDNEALDPAYWTSNLTSPVRFSSAVENLLHHNRNNFFLEVGPHSALAGPLRQICAKDGLPCIYAPSMVRNENSVMTLMAAIGQLYQNGVTFDLAGLHSHGRVLTDLPAYPWDHSASYWYESRLSKDWRNRPHGHHSLLGLRVLETPDHAPCWRNILLLENEPWLIDHKVKKDVVFPLAGYVSMAGEALRQLTGGCVGYSLRHVVAHTALVLNDSRPVELVTALKRQRLSDSAETDSYEFSVSSLSGSTWIRHCEGQVKPLLQETKSPYKTLELERKVSTSSWYDVMANVGIVYGPEFQGLSNIKASTVDHSAAATIANPETDQKARFHLHPASIDTCFQLVLVATAKGLSTGFPQLSVPTLIEELDIHRCTTQMDAIAWSNQANGEAGVECISSEGNTVLRLRGFHLTAIDDEQTALSLDKHAGARLAWEPDFDFQDNSAFLTPPKVDPGHTLLLEELSLLCMLESADRLEDLETPHEHMRKFRDWLKMEINRAEIGTYPLVKNAGSYVKQPRQARIEMIDQKYSELLSTSRAAVATGLHRILENTAAIFTGETDALNVLMEDGVLTEIYDAVSFGHTEFVRVLAHTKPNLRILEVGAGTGGTTELILRDLVKPDTHPPYSVYTFTDISAGFFPQAKKRFDYAPNMEYKVFDIANSPFEQGFEPESYDLILAPNVVHATANLHETLSNLQPLLAPNGLLVLTEICAVVRAPNYIFGNFSGWWLGEEDGRPYEPYVPVERWQRELKDAGFTEADVVVHDAPQPYGFCVALVSHPQPKSEVCEVKDIVILTGNPGKGIAAGLQTTLETQGYRVTAATLADLAHNDRPVISVLDLEEPFLENITEENFTSFQNFLRSYSAQDLLWLTRPCQIDCNEPRAAQTIGMARGVRSELNIPLVTLEIDFNEPKFFEHVLRVFKKVSQNKDTERLAPDREYAVKDGEIMLGRYQPLSLHKELRNCVSTDTSHAKKLEITKPGLLDSLQWVEERIPAVLADGEVEVEIHAVGMNFRDIVYAMGVISPDTEDIPLGVEFAGIVRNVGPKVTNITPGLRVLGLAPHGCMTTKLVLPAPLVVGIPEKLTFEDAASMPACYATVIESLLNIARLEEKQTVLIHSAAGGVGHAAIQLCKMIDAEIYATVGTEDKVQYLVDNFGIPRDHIFNSRDDSFVDGIRKVTDGRGVDVVLNSLSGELLHASWKCVAAFGKLVEIGKRDLMEHGKLDMHAFLQNRSYCCVDIAQYIRDRPEATGRMLKKALDLYIQGYIQPLSPLSVFKAADIEQGFRYLQKGTHIGKAVVNQFENSSELQAVGATPSASFDRNATYLLVGGLGGLGRSLATWMVEHGARELIFLSRSAERQEHTDFFQELTSVGCNIISVAGCVDVVADVRKAVSKATRPIRGVMQLAMILCDAPFVDMTYSEWTTTIKPKVDGTWNLHNELADQPLDFFWMASSLVTLVNQPGQSNYNAANTFLESFCQYRRNLGLPASVLSICPIEGVGFVSENRHAKRNVKAQGLYLLGEKEFLDYVELSILKSSPRDNTTLSATKKHHKVWESHGHFIMGLHSEIHLDDPNNRTNWRRDRRMGTYHNRKDADSSQNDTYGNSKLREFLGLAAMDSDVLRQDSSKEFLACEVGRRVFDFMLKPEEEVDISQSLSQIGLDSLMAIELRRWWKQMFGLDISVLEIMGTGTIRELGELAADGVRKKLETQS